MTKSKATLQAEIVAMVGSPRANDSEKEFTKRELFRIHGWVQQHGLMIDEMQTQLRKLERTHRADR